MQHKAWLAPRAGVLNGGGTGSAVGVHAQTTTSEVQAPMFALRHALHALILTFRVKGVDVAGDNAGIPRRTERAGPAFGAQKVGEGHRGQVEREGVQKARVGFFASRSYPRKRSMVGYSRKAAVLVIWMPLEKLLRDSSM